jgi:hypothetical protein
MVSALILAPFLVAFSHGKQGDDLAPNHHDAVGLEVTSHAISVSVSFESLRGLYRLFREAAGLNVLLSGSIGEPGSSESQVETDSAVLLSRKQPPHTLRIVALKSQGM